MTWITSTMQTDHKKLLLLMILLRGFMLSIVQSSYVPDEYWQCLEIAHKTVFGYGYLTWEWTHAIRSFFYPFWFALAYKIVEILRLDYRNVLVYLPQLMQAIMSAYADTCFVLWSRYMLGASNNIQASWINHMWATCLFVSYCSSRTLTNTLELNLTIIALYYYPWSVKKYRGNHRFVWFIGLSCLARPTAAILWMPLCVYDVVINQRPYKHFVNMYLSRIFKISVLCILIDFLFYKRLVFTPLNFFMYNFAYDVGTYYGVHSFSWYVITGIPVVLGPLCLPFYQTLFKISYTLFIFQYKKFMKYENEFRMNYSVIDILLFFTVLWTLFWYSFIPHKEFRFVLPLAPIMFYLSALNFKNTSSVHLGNFVKSSFYVTLLTISMVLFNVFGIFYLGRWHQTGPLKVMSVLAEEASKRPESKFLFLMPCHSTPFYSHVHVNVTMQFLTCEPNFSNDLNYKDESDLFFEHPVGWLSAHYPATEDCNLPSHVILFSSLRMYVDDFLNRYNYSLWKTEFHALFNQGRQSEYIDIFRLNWNKPKHCFS